MKRILHLKTINEIRTMTDPYRMKILQVFSKYNRAITVKEIAVEMNEVHGKVYYHVQKMMKVGALEITKTEKINGIVAKYYEIAFDEMIVGDDKLEDDHAEEAMDSMSLVIGGIFDEHKNAFIEGMSKLEGASELEAQTALVSADLRFNDESFSSFMKDLTELIEKHSLSQTIDQDKPCAKKFFYTLYK